MAANGPTDQSSLSLVFASMTQAESFRRYLVRPNTSQTWRLRESRVDGCLTADDCENRESYRFCLTRNDNNQLVWEFVNDGDKATLSQSQPNFVYMNKTRANDSEEKCEAFKALLKLLEDEYQLSVETMIVPNRQEQSRDRDYAIIGESNYYQRVAQKGTLSEQQKAKLELRVKENEATEPSTCPISLEELGEAAAITPAGHAYDPAALETWVGDHPTDPLTRDPLDMSQVLITQGPKKKKEALNKTAAILNEDKERKANRPG